MVKKNACVFISGFGSNLKSLISRSRDPNFPVRISLIISNRSTAKGLLHAKKNSIPFVVIDTAKNNYEIIILNLLKKYQITLICLAGYMKILSNKFIKSFNNNILNVHPSLLPKYKGLNTFKKVLNNNEVKTGCTVHFVNEKFDSGKIIIQKVFYVEKKDNLKTLKDKTQQLEYKAFPEAIIKIYRKN